MIVCDFSYEAFIDSEIGKMFTQMLWEAETHRDADERGHGEWMREKFNQKIKQHRKAYH